MKRAFVCILRLPARFVRVDYRLELPGFELPESVRRAQLEFDNRLAGALAGMADRMEEECPEAGQNLEESFKLLNRGF